MRITLLFLFAAALHFFGITAVHASGRNWTAEQSSPKIFIENKGQFVLPENYSARKILFGAEFGPQVYFTTTGLIYGMQKEDRMSEEEKEKYLEHQRDGHKEAEEGEKEQTILRTYYIEMEWEGVNPNARIVSENKVSEYWNYLDPKNIHKSIDRVSGYKKIIYKDLYPNIDVEYIFHSTEGLKYKLILHPGADISKVKMKYTGAEKVVKNNGGDILFSNVAGNISDQAPETFYASGDGLISSHFNLMNNVVTFELGSYDHSQTVVVDPWIKSGLTPSNTVVEVSSDAANNVYIYGFDGLMNATNPVGHYVQKYNSAGVLQWTFSFTQAMNYIQNTGDISVDPAGNSYVTCGFYFIGYFFFDCMQSKLNTAGTLMWNTQSPQLYENWRNAFNCDFTQLIQLGCGPGCCNVGQGDIINTGTGAETIKFSPPATGDIVSASYGKNGYLYILSVMDTSPVSNSHLSCLNPATGFSVVFSNNYPVSAAFKDGFNTSYGTYGINGLAAGCSYLYLCLGATLEKRNLVTGALIGSVAVPNGVQHSNSGLAVDKCGNIYVGSSTGVYVFDPSLTLLTSFATPFPVLDICMGAGGIFYAVGGTATASTNSGFVAQFNMSSICNAINITTTPNSCGSSNIGTATATALFCSGPYTYVWNTIPPQTTQTATGLAGGNYTVIVTGAGACNEKDTAVATIPAGLLVVTVPPYVNVSCKGGNNGSANISASGGTSPYTYIWNPTAQTTSAASGLSAGIYSVTVTDASGCSGTQTISITEPAALSASVSSTPAACGGNNGSASVSASGGTMLYTYAWNPSGQTTQSASNLSSGNYSVMIADANGCTSSAAVTVAATGSLTATASNDTICIGQTAVLNAYGGTNYSWSNGATASTIQVSPFVITTYSVIVSAGSCSDTAFATVVVNPGPSVSAFSNTTITAGSSTTLSASGGNNYTWSTGETTAVISVSPVVTTTYCVSSTSGGCIDSACVIVYIQQTDNCNYADDQFFVPDAFSPNNDTKNDVLELYYPDISCIKDLEFVIYDRWGEKVFEASNLVSTWDGNYKGKMMNTAVFAYYLRVTLLNDKEILRKGNISLIR